MQWEKMLYWELEDMALLLNDKQGHPPIIQHGELSSEACLEKNVCVCVCVCVTESLCYTPETL